jgi:hypothetical protein
MDEGRRKLPMSSPGEADEGWLTRRLGVHAWPVAAGLLYTALFLLAMLLVQLMPSPPRLCIFHTLTGHPCPTCGATRCWLALAQGRWLDALWYNPLWFTLTLAAGPLLLVGAYRRQRGKRLLPQSALWRSVLGIGLAVLVIANWTYLWIAGI